MIQRKKTRHFTEDELCDFFDITPQSFRITIRPNIPHEAIDKSTKPVLYHGRTVIEVYCAHRQKQSFKTRGKVDDPSVKSSARENLYEEQYRIAKMRRLEMSKRLISTRKVQESLGHLQTMLRELGEQFKRTGATKPLDLLNETLDRFAREVTDLWNRAWKKPTK